MKIRIRGQSIRLRLGRSEVATLARGNRVEETISFGPIGRFGCVLRAGGEQITHAFVDGVVIFDVPQTTIAGWAATDAVGFAQELPLDDGRSLRLLVEKDFACLSAADETQADAYPNPSAACGPTPERL